MPKNTINSKLEGKNSEVPFERMETNVFGRKVEGVFPKFEAKAEVILDEYYDSREFYDNNRTTCYNKQMQQASRQLAAKIDANPAMAAKLGLSDRQVADFATAPQSHRA